jgi:hypothetical protein
MEKAKPELFRWHKGRQEADYDVLTFMRFPPGKPWVHRLPWGLGWDFRLGADAHIIRYAGPFYLPPHTDPVDGKRHYRLNVVIGRKGRFDTAGSIFNWRGRIILFRPDKCPHGLKLEAGRRYVLSFGVAF